MSDFYNKYPYTDFHELNLDWVIERVKKLTEDWLATHEEWVGVQEDWADTEQAWIDFKAYVENYLANLDVQDEIDHKIDQMVADGSLRTLIKPDVLAQTISTTTEWLNDHITQPTTPVVDTSLTIPGAAADAAVTGNNFSDAEKIMKNVITTSGLDLCELYRPDFTMNGISFTYTNSGRPKYHLSGTSTAGIVTTLAVTANGSNYRYYVDKFEDGTKIKITGALNNHVRLAIQAFDSADQSLGYTQDSGSGVIYSKTSNASYILFIVIIDNNITVNDDIYPSFIIDGITPIWTLNANIEDNSESLQNTIITNSNNIWSRMTDGSVTSDVTITKMIKDGKMGYHLSGTSSSGIIYNIGGYKSGYDTGDFDISLLEAGSTINIGGGLSQSIRTAIEAFTAQGVSLGFTQDSGKGAEYVKTSTAAFIRLYMIIDTNTVTNVDIFPTFTLKGSTIDIINNNIYMNKADNYRNICDIKTQTATTSGVTFTRTNVNGFPAFALSGTSTSAIFFYLSDTYIKNPFDVDTPMMVGGSFNAAIRVAIEYKDANLSNTQYKQDMGNTPVYYKIDSNMYYYRPLIIINNNTVCDNVLIIPKFILADSLQNVHKITQLKIMTFGDSIIADDFAGIGTKIAEVGNMKLVKNWAHGGSTASDWYYQGSDISPIELDFNNMYQNGNNVLANQVRAALQYTTPLNDQITWYHPVAGTTFSIPTADGVGLGHTDEIPDIIFISACTNDGHSSYLGEKTTSVIDDVSSVITENYQNLDRSSIASGIRWAVETLQCAYPNAIIFVNSAFQAGYADAASDPDAFSYAAGDTKRQIIEKISRFCSTHYIDSFSDSGYSFLVAQNGGGLHPNGINRYNIAKYLFNEIDNRYTDRKKWY